MIIYFLISFSSFLSQSLLVKSVYFLVHDDSLSYSVAAALIFIGMSSGSLRASRMTTFSRKKLFDVEISILFWTLILGLFLAGAPLLKSYIDLRLPSLDSANFSVLILYALGSLCAFKLGQQLGIELCLVYFFFSSKSERSVGIAVGWTYMGGLVASLLCTFWFFRTVNPTIFFAVSAGISVVLGFYFFIYARNESSFGQNLWAVSKLALALIFLIYFFVFDPWAYETSKFFEYRLIKSPPEASVFDQGRNLKKRMSLVSEASAFQVLDWMTYQGEPTFSRLYLDGSFQFDTAEEQNYHTPFWEGGLHFSAYTPKKILIMGGGDGLLAAKIYADTALEKGGKPEITLVEIDSLVPRWAQKYWPALEKGSLKEVHLELSDAFQYIKKADEKWEAIFLDFPDPRSADLSKLFSVEFYKMVLSHLESSGFVVLDFPPLESFDIIYSTLVSAGFRRVVLYGEGQIFVFADKKDGDLQRAIGASAFKIYPLPKFDETRINSVFRMTLPQ